MMKVGTNFLNTLYNQTSLKYSEQTSTKHGIEAFLWRCSCCVFFVCCGYLCVCVCVCVCGGGGGGGEVFSPGFHIVLCVLSS